MADTVSKPREVQWVPFGFAILASIIAIVAYCYPGPDSARQGAFNIALTLASSAGSIYATQRSNATSSTATSISTPVVPPTPPTPLNPL